MTFPSQAASPPRKERSGTELRGRRFPEETPTHELSSVVLDDGTQSTSKAAEIVNSEHPEMCRDPIQERGFRKRGRPMAHDLGSGSVAVAWGTTETTQVLPLL